MGESLHQNTPPVDRKRISAVAAAPLLALGLVVSACSSPEAGEFPPPIDHESTVDDFSGAQNIEHDGVPTLYLPTWLGDRDAGQIAEATEGVPVRYNIAFALPGADGTVELPDTELIQPLLTTAESIGLSIGGWGGSDEEHEQILKHWQAALDNPDQFATSVTEAADALGAETLDFDMEYPTSEQRVALLGLMRAVRERNPDRTITLAVPAFPEADNGYALNEDELPSVVDQFNVMAYDYNGSWSDAAGHHADGRTTIDAVSTWVETVGDESKVSPGFPIYGYVFEGAEAPGDSFTNVQTLPSTEILARGHTVDDDQEALASSAQIDGGWATFLSPAMVTKIDAELRQQFPELGDAFFWEASGTSREYLAAVGAEQ